MLSLVPARAIGWPARPFPFAVPRSGRADVAVTAASGLTNMLLFGSRGSFTGSIMKFNLNLMFALWLCHGTASTHWQAERFRGPAQYVRVRGT